MAAWTRERNRYAGQRFDMERTARVFLDRLLETPSVSGYEQEIQCEVVRWAMPLADEVHTDTHGNVIAVLQAAGHPRILLDAHCDQIGLLVQYIDSNGFVYFVPVGGWDPLILLGQQVTVWSAKGPIPGVIARKPKHLLNDDENKKIPDLHQLWIDIGARSQEEAASWVEVGDPVTLTLGARAFPNDLLAGTKMDDTVGLFVVFETLRRLRGTSFAPAVYFVSAVQEEIGLRGAQTAAYGVNPHAGIAVDVTHATDCPTIDKKANGDIKLGGGPVIFRGPNVNPVLRERILQAASTTEIAVQRKAAHKGLSNDTNAIQLVRAGVATACLGIPNRYMHSPVEMISLNDVNNAAMILTALIQSIPADIDFRPTTAPQSD